MISFKSMRIISYLKDVQRITFISHRAATIITESKVFDKS